jgi:iron-sulfur cluster assembly protein
MKQIVTITDNAADYIRSVMAKGTAENEAILGLRVSIKKGGCSGSEYDFQYATEKGQYDEVVEDKGVRVFVDPAATLKIIGSELDYVKDKFSAQLLFNNPNELGRCGCGKSVEL